jgi:hypothetical protein
MEGLKETYPDTDDEMIENILLSVFPQSKTKAPLSVRQWRFDITCG